MLSLSLIFKLSNVLNEQVYNALNDLPKLVVEMAIHSEIAYCDYLVAAGASFGGPTLTLD